MLVEDVALYREKTFEIRIAEMSLGARVGGSGFDIFGIVLYNAF